ncbi:ATP-binding protein [Gilvimarinus polysaccharolyticus]|uniref:ATP-binding protein n=1 Tax=Gilvimarinus polysaccharolyticus TaxID=863921 RepID=UPI00067317AF|nr:ATP-binding protein [Gilvimarinus polysaccharolyticus]
MKTPYLTLKAPSEHYRQLIMMRWVVIITLIVAALLINRSGVTHLPLTPILLLLLLLSIINGGAFLRLGHSKSVTAGELSVQLLIDIIAVAAVAYFTGGATNPFLSYVLVPVCIGAATLPSRNAWAVSAVGIILYGLLLHWYVPLQWLAPPGDAHAHHSTNGLNLHVLGMWLNFALSAVLISFFVARMAGAVRVQQNELNRRREEDLRDEQLLAVAAQAAGTAHELGTPLSTMKVLLADLRQDTQARKACGDDLDVLYRQVNHCAEILTGLRARSDLSRLHQPQPMPAQQYCTTLLEHWQLLRPEARPEICLDTNLTKRQVCFHATIEQAIINVLNNAADACPEHLTITVSSQNDSLVWQVDDRGEGLPEAARNAAGKTFFSSKPNGMGLGLFLTHASIQRFGGTVVLTSRPEGGTTTTITLPLDAQHD